jgi:hypothetical protein
LRLFLSLILLFAGMFAASAAVRSEVQLSEMPDNRKMQILFEQGWYQVRVQQRVIIRVPGRVEPPKGSAPRKVTYREEKMEKCISMNQLAGARPGPGKEQNLEFVSKSGQLYRAYLGDGCLAREFYAGAYMEKSLDGRLCEERDLVHARTGAKCEIDKFKRLVASAQ